MEKKRNINLDIIRIFALITVMSVHFFLNSEFYTTIIEAKKRFFFMVSIREFFMVCVPLFLILTGYLNNKKKLEAKYYKSIIPRVLVVIIINVILYYFNVYYNGYSYDPKQTINFLFHYNNGSYSWYVNMYFGLFLLIPFLNLIYNNLETKKQKELLLLSLTLLTVVPSLFVEYTILLPTWWFDIYPIMYYFVGCYLSEYELKLNKTKSFILLVLFVIGFGLIIYNKSLGLVYQKLSYNANWYGIMPFTLSILTFNILIKLKLNKIPKWTNKIIIGISNLVFGAYLLSKISDTIVYKYLNTNIVFKERIFYAPLCVLTVFISSMIMSYFVNLFVKLIMWSINLLSKLIKNKIKEKKQLSIG